MSPQSPPAAPLLTIRNLHSGYGGVDILQGVSLRVDFKEIVVIIGPNGAGKSTVLKSLFGLAQVSQGDILWRDHDITRWRSDRLVREGICYVPQVNNVFPTLTVQENLELGAFVRSDSIRPQVEQVYGLFPDLKHKRFQPAGTLSGGQRQMAAMGRALMVAPQLLLLDEPTAGLSPRYVNQIFEIVHGINQQGVSILMVEQNAKQALSLAHRGYVLAMGNNRHEDTGENLLNDPHISRLFLGG